MQFAHRFVTHLRSRVCEPVRFVLKERPAPGERLASREASPPPITDDRVGVGHHERCFDPGPTLSATRLSCAFVLMLAELQRLCCGSRNTCCKVREPERRAGIIPRECDRRMCTQHLADGLGDTSCMAVAFKGAACVVAVFVVAVFKAVTAAALDEAIRLQPELHPPFGCDV